MKDLTAIITIGCPASGKSTYAKSTGYEIIERDMERELLAGSRKDFYKKFSGKLERDMAEALVSEKINNKIRLAHKNKNNIVISDTNINDFTRHHLLRFLFDTGYKVKVELFDTPLEVLLERNEQREEDNQVPSSVIEKMFFNLEKQKDKILKEIAVLNTRYGGEKTKVIVCDIDGTIAEKGKRSPFDETKVDEDTPIPHIIDLIKNYIKEGYEIVYLSGRTEGCYDLSKAWLEGNVGSPVNRLYMRNIGDSRKDWIVKGELFKKYVDENVYLVLDDRQQVVDIWNNFGLNVLQVAQNRF